MIYTPTKLAGAFIVDVRAFDDERGFLAETFQAREFEAHGLNGRICQCNVSYNHRKGTLRGMHYQVAPAEECKFIRCIRGAIYDVVVDLRPGSATYGQWLGVELTADNRRAIYIPPMFAHGYQALCDGAEAMYLVSEFYAPPHARGFRYDDPAFAIEWPLAVSVISPRDANWPPVQR